MLNPEEFSRNHASLAESVPPRPPVRAGTRGRRAGSTTSPPSRNGHLRGATRTGPARSGSRTNYLSSSPPATPHYMAGLHRECPTGSGTFRSLAGVATTLAPPGEPLPADGSGRRRPSDARPPAERPAFRDRILFTSTSTARRVPGLGASIQTAGRRSSRSSRADELGTMMATRATDEGVPQTVGVRSSARPGDPRRPRSRDPTEWLFTMDSGYAMGTLRGLATRSYHGWPRRATDRPSGGGSGRRLVERATLGAGPCTRRHSSPTGRSWVALGAPGVVPARWSIPAWRFAIEEAIVERRVWMARARTRRTSATAWPRSHPVELAVSALTTDRDFTRWLGRAAARGDAIDGWAVVPLVGRRDPAPHRPGRRCRRSTGPGGGGSSRG